MAILKTLDDGWILDELLFYKNIYYENNYKSTLYKIEEPFLFQSQLEALKRKSENVNLQKTEKPPKRKRPPVKRFVVDGDHLSILCKLSEQTFANFVSTETTLNIFEQPKPLNLWDNNKTAKEALANIFCTDGSVSFTTVPNFQETSFQLKHKQTLDRIYSNCIYFNPLNSTISVQIEKTNSFIIPPNSRFICGDVKSALDILIKEQNKYDLIIIDPPWENKSIKRKRNYEMLPEHDLCKLSISNVLAVNGLLAIWVTNNRRLLNFVKEVLFKTWKFKLVAEWIWLKSTTCAQPVCEFRDDFKMPFEIVLFGVHEEHCYSDFSPKLPHRKYFLSVPCIVPSRKVSLLEILKNFLPANHSTLELFARNLLPNATSVGDEVLKMQNERCFERENGVK